MDIIREMFTITFSQFMVGSVALLAFIPFRVLGRGFFKTCAWIFVMLGLLLWWFAPRPPVYGGLGSLFGATLWSTPKGREFGAIIVFVCLTILYLIALYRWGEAAVKTILGVAVAVGVFSVINSAAAMRDPVMTSFQTEMLPANFLLSALAMGTVFTGMLLGHYYLVKPDLPLKPLWKFTWLLFAVLIAQGAGLLTMVVKEFGPEQLKVVWGSNVFLTEWGLEFWSRILVGLVATFLVAVVIVISLRMHATRTATGFYYIGIMTVLVGELMSRNLFRLTHLPL